MNEENLVNVLNLLATNLSNTNDKLDNLSSTITNLSDNFKISISNLNNNLNNNFSSFINLNKDKDKDKDKDKQKDRIQNRNLKFKEDILNKFETFTKTFKISDIITRTGKNLLQLALQNQDQKEKSTRRARARVRLTQSGIKKRAGQGGIKGNIFKAILPLFKTFSTLITRAIPFLNILIALAPIFEKLQGAIGFIITFFTVGLVALIRGLIIKGKEFFTEVDKNIKSFFTVIGSNILNTFTEVYKNIESFFTVIGSNILNTFTEVYKNIESFFTIIGSNTLNAFSDMFKLLKNIINKVIDRLKDIPAIGKLFRENKDENNSNTDLYQMRKLGNVSRELEEEKAKEIPDTEKISKLEQELEELKTQRNIEGQKYISKLETMAKEGNKLAAEKLARINENKTIEIKGADILNNQLQKNNITNEELSLQIKQLNKTIGSIDFKTTNTTTIKSTSAPTQTYSRAGDRRN